MARALEESKKLITSSRNNIKTALSNKGVSTSSIPKVSEVASLISSIEGTYNFTIYVTTNAQMNGYSVTAKQDSSQVTATISNGSATLTIPKAGSWTVTNTATSETLTVNFENKKSISLT